MIHELENSDFDKAQALFSELAVWQPFCGAVLSGVHPGRVFVDDPSQPRAGFVNHDDAWCFLSGEPDAGTFNQDLGRAIFDRQAVPQDSRSLILTCQPEDWDGHLPAIFGGQTPVPMRRRHYVCFEMPFDWRVGLPEGVEIRPMEEGLLRDRHLRVPDDVVQTIRKWRSLAGPRFQDYGFVAVLGGEVASWATVDAIVGGVGDLGFFTQPRYRQRGLGTAVTAAALEHGLHQGMSAVNWTCAEDNAASVRTAEKLGLQRRPDYTLYAFAFDGVEHVSMLAYHYLVEGQHLKAAEMLEEALTRPDPPPVWAHYDAARARAALGDPVRALEHLNAAVDGGWTEVEDTKEFEILHDEPGWKDLLRRIRQRQGQR
ncbi:MAG: GNAT family N-acetyltransferase [Anaerolineae bacterium]|jgi:GNAT superfamily N-acetyltransferase